MHTIVMMKKILKQGFVRRFEKDLDESIWIKNFGFQL